MAGALGFMAAPAYAQEQKFELDVPSQRLDTALRAFAQQSRQQLMFAVADTKGFNAPALNGSYTADEAIGTLLAGTGLEVRRNASGVFLIGANADPQSGSAAGDGADQGTVEALIVTAQKREENIQDVPIAMSAFSQEDLTKSQVTGGPDLMTQIPNMTFTKTNFTSYSIQIRGIGTQAISATVDPAVAVAFNNSSLIRNRFFEQEFYDLQRVEVLRGPQGTLYGRNATAGVVNIISQKPKLGAYEAKLSVDAGNYSSSRFEGMINIPLANDVAALRLAGAWTKRDGYAFNQITGAPIDGRDLWSTRLSLRFAPTDKLDANLIWEHFEENDDRLRSGKQLCKRNLPQTIGGLAVDYTKNPFNSVFNPMSYEEYFSQGCEAASLYSPDSFQAPVGLRLPYYKPLSRLGLPIVDSVDGVQFDPYASTTQSRDLRVIESTVNPHYQAKTDVLELQLNYDLTDHLTLAAETAYVSDWIFSTQDFNRFNTRPGAFDTTGQNARYVTSGVLTQDGYFCDPQIGCANRLVAVDLSTAKSRQFSQEVRISSDFDGPFNFSLGANFLRYDTVDKYYVFINTLTLAAAGRGTGHPRMPSYAPGVSDNSQCLENGFSPPAYNGVEDVFDCTYIDPNPIGSLNDLGHNYFLSNNPYKLISYAVFGEAYYNLTENLKVTAGLRWTVDKKEAPRIPSWVLAANTVGYPVAEVIEQEWREPTGRLAVDWKPDLTFTDDTLLYASYSHGYKAGGANPPANGLVLYDVNDLADQQLAYANFAIQQAATAPRTFDPEFVNAFEVGAKNTMLDGRLTLNTDAFFYDYKGYQISQIVNRSAVNLNFDATVWGLELEADWRPLENLKLGLKGGFEKTRMADGSRAVDLMDRTAGHTDWYVTGPFPTLAANCILPVSTVVQPGGLAVIPSATGGIIGPCEVAYVLGLDPLTAAPYQANPPQPPTGTIAGPWYPGYPGFDPANPEINGGAGFYKDLSGNELPNAPHMTATITADYTLPLPSNWLMTLHTDLYYQSEAWTRVFNTAGYDKLKAYSNINVAAIFTNEDAGWKVMAYVKNVLDRDSITGAFLNSDDTGLTTNVFLTEPRLYGLRVTKDFSGGPWWTGANLDHKGPFPLTVELGGQIQRHDAPYETLHAPLMDVPDYLENSADVQNHDLDWGDGRSLRLIYRPEGSPWKIAAGVRYGRTNSDDNRVHNELYTKHRVCGVDPEFFTQYGFPSGYFADMICDPQNAMYNADASNFEVTEWSDAASRYHEKHTIVDFEVGREVGLGSLFSSEVDLGLRHADFESSANLRTAALGNYTIPPGWSTQLVTEETFGGNVEVEREFKGAGPTASWTSAIALLGDDRDGKLELEWSVTGGALFGDMKTSVTQSAHRELRGTIGEGSDAIWPNPIIGVPDVVETSDTRSSSVTVPLVDLSLGLSYDVGRINLGAGYRWERYFDVLDVGQNDTKKADRTIDGPYFKIAVGFGG